MPPVVELIPGAAVRISCASSGQMVCVDAQNIPWAWDPRVALWKHVAQLGKAIDIAIGADGALWAISMDNKLRSFQFARGVWAEVVSPLVRRVCVTSADKVTAIGTDHKCLIWNPRLRRMEPHRGEASHFIATADNNFYDINGQSRKHVYEWIASKSDWKQMAGAPSNVVGGAARVCTQLLVWTQEGKAHMRTPAPGQALGVYRWTPLAALARIVVVDADVGADGTIAIVARDHKMYRLVNTPYPPPAVPDTPPPPYAP